MFAMGPSFFEKLSAAGGGVTVTWNPSDKSAYLTLSSGNLVVGSTQNGIWNSLRATLAVNAATANNYFETVLTVGLYLMVGVSTNDASLINSGSYLGINANGFSYYNNNGDKITGGSQTAYGLTAAAGDVIGVLLKNGYLYFSKNGAWLNGADPIAQTGWAFSGLTGSLYPALSIFESSASATGRFSSASFTGVMPAGTSSWGGA